jgi:hypothetical protein
VGPINNDEAYKMQKEALSRISEMKKTLKGLSKNQLILLVIQQVNVSLDQQNINKILMRQLEELKGDKKNEESK